MPDLPPWTSLHQCATFSMKLLLDTILSLRNYLLIIPYIVYLLKISLTLLTFLGEADFWVTWSFYCKHTLLCCCTFLLFSLHYHEICTVYVFEPVWGSFIFPVSLSFDRSSFKCAEHFFSLTYVWENLSLNIDEKFLQNV